MKSLSVSVAVLAMGACTSVPPTLVTTQRVSCPAALTAPATDEPAPVVLSAEQRLASDVGAIRAVGADLAARDAEQRLQHEAWGREGWSRVAVGREWCAELDSAVGPVADSPG